MYSRSVFNKKKNLRFLCASTCSLESCQRLFPGESVRQPPEDKKTLCLSIRENEVGVLKQSLTYMIVGRCKHQRRPRSSSHSINPKK
jgi:hypothetical protein